MPWATTTLWCFKRKLGRKSTKIRKSALLPDPFVPGMRSTRSFRRSEKAEVSILAVSRTVSDSATEDPRSRP